MLLRTRESSVLNTCTFLTLTNRILGWKGFLNYGEGSDSKYFKLCRPCGPPPPWQLLFSAFAVIKAATEEP